MILVLLAPCSIIWAAEMIFQHVPCSRKCVVGSEKPVSCNELEEVKSIKPEIMSTSNDNATWILIKLYKKKKKKKKKQQ